MEYQRCTSSGSPTANACSPSVRWSTTHFTASRSGCRGPMVARTAIHAPTAHAARSHAARGRRAWIQSSPAARSTATPGTVKARNRAYSQLLRNTGNTSATSAPPREITRTSRTRASRRAAASPASTNGSAASEPHAFHEPPSETSIIRPSGPRSVGSLPSSARNSRCSATMAGMIGA